jgi:hypothetical protein
VVLTNLEDQFFTDFDYAIVTTYDPKPATNSSSGSGSSSSDKSGSSTQDNNSSTPVAAIAGGVVGGIVLLAIIGILIFLIFRQRRKNKGDTIMSQKGQDALGHEFAPGVSVAAMASYGGPRGPSPQRSYADGLGSGYAGSTMSGGGTLGYSPAAAAGMAGSFQNQQGQYGYGQQRQMGMNEPFLGAGGMRNGSQVEVDLPPPDYDRVFTSSQTGSSGAGGSQAGGSSAGGSLPVPPDPQNTRVFRELREKGVVIPQTGVTRMA